MKNLQSGFVVPLVIVIVTLFLIGTGAYVYIDKNLSPSNTDKSSYYSETASSSTDYTPSYSQHSDTAKPLTNTTDQHGNTLSDNQLVDPGTGKIRDALPVIINKTSSTAQNTTSTIPQTSSTSSISGYVVYVSPFGEVGCGMLPDGNYTTPCDPEYDFFILSDSNNPIYDPRFPGQDVSPQPTPTMTYFPAITNPHYKYISFKGLKGAFPNVGDNDIVYITIDNKVKLNPPYTFPMKATSINSDAGLGGMIQDSFKYELFFGNFG